MSVCISPKLSRFKKSVQNNHKIHENSKFLYNLNKKWYNKNTIQFIQNLHRNNPQKSITKAQQAQKIGRKVRL
jgi:hypothetical protein